MKVVVGDLFTARPEAIGHGVNCVGVMGAGIARVFKKEYPLMYQAYHESCKNGELNPGGVMVWEALDGQVVYNLATQPVPGAAADLQLVEESVRMMCDHASRSGVNVVNLPKIGCGIGGLNWNDVREVLERIESEYPVELCIYSLD